MKREFIASSILVISLLLWLVTGAWAKTATLSWDASPSDVAGYKVYYSVGSSGPPFEGNGAAEGGSPIDVGNVLTVTVNNLSDSDAYFFAVTAYDVAGNESTYSNMVESPAVSVANHPPELSSIGNKTIIEGGTISFALTASDVDGDSLAYSAVGLPSGAGFNAATATFNWTPSFEQSGIYTVTFIVSDGQQTDAETITMTVTNLNRSPILAAIGTQTVPEGSLLTFTVSGSDPDGGTLIYSAANLPSGAVFNPANRSFSWVPGFDESENTRIYPVTFTISDGLAQDSETVTINVTNVNRAPVLAPVGPQTLAEGDVYQLVVNASDPDNNPLVYSAGSLPAGAVFTPATRTLSWIPGSEQSGTYQVTFNVSDGTLSDSELVVFTVTNGNEAPVLNPIGNRTVSENSLLTFVVSAADANHDNLTYSASGLPAGASFNAAQQTFSWTPNYAQAGTFSVQFLVSDGVSTDSETVSITVVNTNRPPVINGTPDSSLMATTGYSFTPSATDADGDSLTFSIVNKPSWATFETATGKLSGVPADSQIGSYPGISLSVSDGQSSTLLPAFSIEVVAYVHKDSDGDGVLDHLDAFPDDGSEWEDTDGDMIGNNSDTDDDNDGVADARDGAPLDAATSGWVISATAGSGGYITPDGDTQVLYGGTQAYLVTPMAGYYINDLRVDNSSVGLVSRYEFTNVSGHHSIEAVFAPIPAGLSHDPAAPGLAGVERTDGGDDRNNLVAGKPKQDLDFRFMVRLRDNAMADQRKVYLVLNGYKYEMKLAGGVLPTGADYICTTRLGPIFSHRFYFVAQDLSGTQLWRYPATGNLPGPEVELLNGKNVVGIAAGINAYALDSLEAFNDKQVYRWIPDSGPNGSFKLADADAPITSGEGYVLKRASETALPNLEAYGEISAPVYEIPVRPGWNLISNPYAGNVPLADVLLRHGASTPIDWLSAVESNLVVDLVYSYLGADWGNGNEFASAAGSKPATLVPWIGYWIYVNPTDQAVSLQISKPLQ